MKRILMVSTHGYFEGNPSFGRADTGGQIVFVIELSKALAKFGYKVDILSRQFEDFEEIEQLNEHVRIVRIPCGGSRFIPKEYLVEYLPELIDGFEKYFEIRFHRLPLLGCWLCRDETCQHFQYSSYLYAPFAGNVERNANEAILG